MRRLPLLIAMLALVAAGCSSELGRSVPECDTVGGSLVLAVQSVPGSSYVSCVNGLRAGWEYNHLTAVAGESTYNLDSDRMGSGFVRVDNVRSCDNSAATSAGTVQPGVELWKDVTSDTSVDIVIVPEGLTIRTMTSVRAVAEDLEGLDIDGKPITVTTSSSGRPTTERIDEAAQAGAHVVIISVRDAEEGTFTLRVQGSENEVTLDDLDDVLDEIEEVEGEASYRGTWYFVFAGGCVVYTFDAEGPGVDTIETDITTALSLYDADELRQIARDAGYRVP